ncbi:MAG: DUF4399 domain-containing protein [Pseudorhodoplanes sp.]
MLRIIGSGLALAFGLALSVATAGAQTAPGKGGPTPSAAGAEVYFINIKDGQKLPRKFTVQFGLRNMGLAPAGSDRANSGHHHLLIDTALPKLDEPIPSDFNHLHFGAGQSEEEITLPVGEHTLQLLFGDRNHVPHAQPVVSEKIRITVIDSLPAAHAAAPVEPAPAKVAPVQPAEKPTPQQLRQQKRQQLQQQKQQQQRQRAQSAGAAAVVGRAKVGGRGNWCARKFGTDVCGYTSFEQCMAGVSGESGFCIQK